MAFSNLAYIIYVVGMYKHAVSSIHGYFGLQMNVIIVDTNTGSWFGSVFTHTSSSKINIMFLLPNKDKRSNQYIFYEG